MNKPTCRIDNCGRPRKYVQNGLCGMHYKRIRKYASYEIPDAPISALGAVECWRPVVGWAGRYEVSDHGRVRSVPRTTRHGNYVRGKLVRMSPSNKGYLKVTLCRDGTESTLAVHRVVLEAFVGAPDEGTEACHNNGDKTDNRLSNLRWDTHSENVLDIGRHGRNVESNKTVCPRGHVLAFPNLYTKQGKRTCLACKREHTASHNEHRAFDVEKAHDRYSQIVELAVGT